MTVDPERDTPEVLKNYVASFDPSFVALRGSPEQTAAAAKEFKVFYAKVDGKTPGSYTMDHTAASYVLDPDGQGAAVRALRRRQVGPDRRPQGAAPLRGLKGGGRPRRWPESRSAEGAERRAAPEGAATR